MVVCFIFLSPTSPPCFVVRNYVTWSGQANLLFIKVQLININPVMQSAFHWSIWKMWRSSFLVFILVVLVRKNTIQCTNVTKDFSIFQDILCNADYTLEIRAISYSNPSNRDYNGDCCDPGFFSCNKCDVDFKFCVRAKGTSATSTGCWYSVKTSDDKSDSSGITFPSSGELYGGAGLKNPITFSRTGSWPVSQYNYIYITELTA